VEAGPEKRRRRSAIDTSIHSYELMYTSAEVATFLAFFKDDTYSGALVHVQEHPRTHAEMTAQFVGEPNVNEVTTGLYKVSVSVRELP